MMEHAKSVLPLKRETKSPESRHTHELRPDEKSQIRHRRNRQRAATYRTARVSDIHFQTCYYLIKEMFDEIGLHLPPTGFSFLDIACAPGGFSQFLLDGAEDRSHCHRGFGVTLPAELGGFPMGLRHPPACPYLLCYYDLLSPPSMRAPFVPSLVEFCIADAQYLPGKRFVRSYTGCSFESPELGKLALLVAQLRLGFGALADGGTFVHRFSATEKLSVEACRLLILMIELFDSAVPFKSEYVHQTDWSFYLVCRGFRRQLYLSRDIEHSLLEGHTVLFEHLLGEKDEANRPSEPTDKAPPKAPPDSFAPPDDTDNENCHYTTGGLRWRNAVASQRLGLKSNVAPVLYPQFDLKGRKLDIFSQFGSDIHLSRGFSMVAAMFDFVWRCLAIGESNALHMQALETTVTPEAPAEVPENGAEGSPKDNISDHSSSGKTLPCRSSDGTADSE